MSDFKEVQGQGRGSSFRDCHNHLKNAILLYSSLADIASSQYYKKHKSAVTLQKLHQHYKYVAFYESA